MKTQAKMTDCLKYKLQNDWIIFSFVKYFIHFINSTLKTTVIFEVSFVYLITRLLGLKKKNIIDIK